MNKKYLCVPYNGDFNLVKKLVEKDPEKIYEFYGSDGCFIDGRKAWDYEKTPESKKFTFETTIDFLKNNNINFNYLFNFRLIDKYLEEKEKVIEHLKYLKNLGIDTITVSSPYFVSYFLQDLDFEIVISSFLHVYDELMIEELKKEINNKKIRVVLNENEIRNIPLIKKLSKKVDLEIFLNLNCKFSCPYYNIDGIIEHADIQKHCRNYCKGKEKSFLDWLRRTWVRYQDIEKYQKAGVGLFKMTDRVLPSSHIFNHFLYYTQGFQPNNNFFPTFFANTKTSTIILEKDLDNYFNYIFKKGCNRNCSSCNQCFILEKNIKKKYKLTEPLVMEMEAKN